MKLQVLLFLLMAVVVSIFLLSPEVDGRKSLLQREDKEGSKLVKRSTVSEARFHGEMVDAARKKPADLEDPGDEEDDSSGESEEGVPGEDQGDSEEGVPGDDQGDSEEGDPGDDQGNSGESGEGDDENDGSEDDGEADGSEGGDDGGGDDAEGKQEDDSAGGDNGETDFYPGGGGLHAKKVGP